MRFGDNLRNIRIQRHMTQQALADDMNISQASVAAYEANIREPSFEIIEKFARYFRISPYSLLPFGDVFDENEKAIVGELVLENEKLSDLVEMAQHFNESDMNTLLAVATALQAKSNK